MTYLGIVLCKVSISMIFLFVAVVTHIVLKTFYNVAFVEEPWSWGRFKEGIGKMLIVITGTYLLSATLAFFPVFLTMLGVSISNSVIEYLNVTTILLIMLKPTISYTKRNITTLENIINGLLPDPPMDMNEETEDVQEVKEELMDETRSDIIRLNG